MTTAAPLRGLAPPAPPPSPAPSTLTLALAHRAGLDEAIASTAFVALSVERGINVRALWEMLEPLLLPDDEAEGADDDATAPPPAKTSPRRAASSPVPTRRAAARAPSPRDSDADIA